MVFVRRAERVILRFLFEVDHNNSFCHESSSIKSVKITGNKTAVNCVKIAGMFSHTFPQYHLFKYDSCIACAPSKTFYAAGLSDDYLGVFNLPKHELIECFPLYPYRLIHLTIYEHYNDLRIIAAYSNHTIVINKSKSRNPPQILSGHTKLIIFVGTYYDLHAQEIKIISGSLDGTIRLWSPQLTLKSRIFIATPDKTPVTCGHHFIENNCNKLIFGDQKGKLYILNLNSFKCEKFLTGHHAAVTVCSHCIMRHNHQDYSVFISGAADGSIRLWGLEHKMSSPKPEVTTRLLHKDNNTINSAHVSPIKWLTTLSTSHKILMASADDYRINVWDLTAKLDKNDQYAPYRKSYKQRRSIQGFLYRENNLVKIAVLFESDSKTRLNIYDTSTISKNEDKSFGGHEDLNVFDFQRPSTIYFLQDTIYYFNIITT